VRSAVRGEAAKWGVKFLAIALGKIVKVKQFIARRIVQRKGK